MKIDKYFFRIKKNEQSKYSDEGITLDEKYTGKYTAETIRRAKILKAKNEGSNPDPANPKYSDEFYLAYAKSLQLQDILGALNEIHGKRLAYCEIKDKDWAGYSYEEIIEMENQGFNIPEDVLLWAHAQQEADVTDYIIVSDSVNTDDSETTDSVNGNDELQNLQKRARENINKAEKANEIAETKEAEFKKTAKEANKIQLRKKLLHDKSVEKIESMAKEWKELDDKKKNGKLNFVEKIKYASLSKKLNGKDNEDGTMIKSIEADNAVLDEFLTSLDDLQSDVTENLEIARDTTKSGRDLSEFEKNYHQEQLPQVNTGITDNGMGLDSDELYGENMENIADIAIETGKDLEVSTNDISTDIQSDKNAELTKFAQDYTARASEALSNTREIMNGNEEQKENDDEKDKEEKLKSYSVDMEFSHKNAQKAAKTTLLSTANLITHQGDVSKNENTLQKALKTNTKDIKNLNKESKTTEQKHEENLQKEEQLITKLETAQGKTAQGSLEEKVEEAIKAQKKAETQEIPQEANQETATTLEEIKSVDEDDQKLKKNLNKTLSKGIQSDSTSQKAAQTLTANNSNLATRNKNAQQVALDTITVGTGTFAKSFITTAAGEAMYTSGLGLMSSLVTYNAGLALTIAGNYFKGEGQKEFKNGLLATATGTIGLTASAAASLVNSGAQNSVKEANAIFKINKQLFKESAKSTGEENNVQPNQQQTTDSTEQTPELQMQEENITSTTNPELNTTEENTPLQQEEQTPVEETTADKTEQTTPNTPAEEETTPVENTEETQTTEEKENNKQNKNENQAYSVSTEFTASNASKATQTTNQATAELSAYNSQVNGLENSVTSQVKNSKNLTKNIQKEAIQAIAQHQNNIKLADTIKENFANAKAQMDNIQTNDEAASIKTNMEIMSDEYATISNQDVEATNSANQTITKNSIQLDNYKTNVKTLNTELSTFDKLIANQLDVSQKTLGVGIGTTAFGTMHSIQGSNMIAEGTILMANPFTYSIGVIETVMGTLTLTQGLSEISTGTIATATGANGIIRNRNAKETSTESDNTAKNAQNEYKQADKEIQEIKKELTPEQETTEPPKTDDTENNVQQNDEPEKEIIIEEEPEQTELNTTIAASASSNANINNKITTDDKADRKLSRFNMDSIIESKKKQRKVQAVSASARNGK